MRENLTALLLLIIHYGIEYQDSRARHVTYTRSDVVCSNVIEKQDTKRVNTPIEMQ